MAEKAEKKADAPAAAPAAAAGGDPGEKSKGGGGIGALLGKTPVMLGGVMIIEAVVLFGGFKFLGGGGPKTVQGAELAAAHEAESGGEGHGEHGAGGATPTVDKKSPVEIQIVDFKAPNKQSGRTLLVDVRIVAVTHAEYEEKVKATLKSREYLIQDRIRTIIAQSDPEKLGGQSEPGLETLRRQVKYQLDEILGEGIIDEVLVPRCIPLRTDF